MMRALWMMCLAAACLLGGCNVDTFCLRCDGADAGPSTTNRVLDPTGMGDGGAARDSGLGDPDDPAHVCKRGSDELCNGFDDDCDRITDEGYDLDNDPRHCGECGNACTPPNADGVCKAGECDLAGCFDGFADLDPAEAGCEYRCPVFPVQGEACNGLDDDCDGVADEIAELAPAPSDLCKNTAATPCAGTVPICTERNGVTSWYCDYAAGVEFDPDVPNGLVLQETKCDGLDGDCDGVADDGFAALGSPCSAGQGACLTVGTRVCNAAGDDVVCDAATPAAGGAEICNGKDDDCDGSTDEALGTQGMVRITKGALDFWIDIYEASRPVPGSDRSCSDAARNPWVNISHTGASAACAVDGKRLCSEDEWQMACEANPSDGSVTAYPYGNSFDASACNVSEYDPDCTGKNDDTILPTGTPHGCPPPATTACVSAFGVIDLSGNAREWTATQASADPLSYRIKGGSAANIASGTTCGFDFGVAKPGFAFENLGFRCCKDP